ncbi:MAG: hypothetical protein AB1704_26265 [Pseudomonadota bacterium]|uniref:hypothetical protein n=1 Tax=Burkholderiaceae TaxID=119060 RepID=UPI0010F4DCD1|nr:hypothetical protein [Burkholderia sp. 4M9327F10]
MLAILTNLHRFGWLTSRMIAALVWPTARQAPAMARRAAKTLADDKLILRRPLPDGGDCYTLSAAGARLLSEATGLPARSGASLPLGNTVHRACANWYVIGHILEGTTAWTEHEIQTGISPVVSVDGKVPDALVDTPFGLIWAEVENAWKNRRERAKVVHFSRRYLPTGNRLAELAPDLYLARLAIVGTNVHALRAMCRSFADAFTQGDISESQAADVELVLLPVDKSLVAGEPVTGSLWYDGLLPVLAA